jgi:hypothetical protein
VPYSAFNGDLFLGETSDWLSTNPDIKLEALEEPKLNLALAVNKQGEEISMVLKMVPNEDFVSNAGAYFVFVEKSVTIEGKTYENVVRHVEVYNEVLPLNWREGATYWATTTWSQKHFDDPADLAVVAFVQDLSGNVSEREIYQAAYTESTNDVLSLEDDQVDSDSYEMDNIIMYPNPTENVLYMLNVPKNASVEFYAQDGLLVKSEKSKSGLSKLSLAELPTGVYLVRVKVEGDYVSVNKIVKY